MATANWQSDQPTNLNYLSPGNFDFQITKLPKTKYFLTGVTVPGINFSETTRYNISHSVLSTRITNNIRPIDYNIYCR